MQPKVYIILLNYNGWEDTLECLESLLKIDYENYQIIVVDNASPNGSMQKICDWADGKLKAPLADESMRKYSYPHEPKPIKQTLLSRDEAENGKKVDDGLVFINAEENGGFAAGNNIAIRWGLKQNNAEYFLLLNNDTVVDSNMLQELIKKSNKSEVSCGHIFYYDEPEKIWFSSGYFNSFTGRTVHKYIKRTFYSTPFVTGALMFVPQNILNSVGLMREDYFMYFEDVEFCRRALDNNLKIKIIPESVIFHKIGASSVSEFSAFWGGRNRIRYIMEYSNFFEKLISLIFIFISRLLVYPFWFLKSKKGCILSQIKGFISGFKK